MTISHEALDMAAKVEAFVRGKIVRYEQDPRRDQDGAPTDVLVMEMGELARDAGVLAIERRDFTIAVAQADDVLITRDETHKMPRDNVHLEYGISIGSLGRDRSFLLVQADILPACSGRYKGQAGLRSRWPDNSTESGRRQGHIKAVSCEGL